VHWTKRQESAQGCDTRTLKNGNLEEALASKKKIIWPPELLGAGKTTLASLPVSKFTGLNVTGHYQSVSRAQHALNQEACSTSSGRTKNECEITQHPSFTSNQLKAAKLSLIPSIEKQPSLGIIVQARMGSSRLPGKVAKVVGDKEYLLHQIDRVLQRCPSNRCVIATTLASEDDVVCEMAKKAGVEFFRGSSDDVLKRYIDAAENNGFTDVVRLTGDCPLIDPYIMDAIVDVYNSTKSESKYVSNALLRTFPRGFDVEIASVKDLRTAWHSSKSNYDREHVTTYIKSGAIAECSLINCSIGQNLSKWRFTLDTVEDHLQLSKILLGIDSYEMDRVMKFSIDNNLLRLDC
jgi:spore coat polysaccharide biosynthesis protein SpsF